VRPVRGVARTKAKRPSGRRNLRSTTTPVTADDPRGSMQRCNQTGDARTSPCRMIGASIVRLSHSGQPRTTAQYAFPISPRCMANPSRRAPGRVKANRTKPLVSRSRRVMMDTWPRLANS
jgi:hypothetical protein